MHYNNKHGEQKGQPLVSAREHKGIACSSPGPLTYFLGGSAEELGKDIRLLSICSSWEKESKAKTERTGAYCSENSEIEFPYQKEVSSQKRRVRQVGHHWPHM